MKKIRELCSYKEFLKTNVRKDIRGKYKGSFLGVLWSFINPLLTVIVYAIVFPYVLKIQEENYLIFLIVAIIPWNFFTTVIAQGTTCILYNSNIIKKVYFPREILPISVATSGLVNFLISSLIIVLFVLISGIGLSWNILFFPVIAIIQYLFSLGLIFMTSAINIYIRDAEYIINFIVMMLFYATPILYSSSMFPANASWILRCNPLTHIVEAYRDIFYYQMPPNIKKLGIVLMLSIIILSLGYLMFKKLEKGFAEEV